MKYYKQITNKLFYGEWPYKISLKLEGISHLRKYKNLDISESFLSTVKNFYNHKPKFSSIEIEKLLNFSKITKEYIDKEIKIRYEGNRASIYVKDSFIYNNLILQFKDIIISITEPKDELDLEKLLENKKYILCDKLPYGKYKYKILFKDMPSQTKINLIEWAKKYNDEEIKVTKTTEKYYRAGKNYYGSCYCYVKDKNMVLLVGLASQGNIRKTEEFVLRNNIK